MTKNPGEWIRRAVADHQDLVSQFFETNNDRIIQAAGALVAILGNGGKILFFGNGGSAADAQHFASELVGTMGRDWQGLAAIALTTDSSVLTSLANDFDYGSVFARQIRALGKKGDAAIGISTSGRSPNINQGLRVAREAGLHTFAFLGGDGGEALEQAETIFLVPGKETQRIQETHLMLGHLLCEMVVEGCH